MPPLASSRLCRGSLALLTVALCAASVFGQGPEVPSDKGFRRSRIFQMPFSLPTADKARTQQIKLFVKPDQGGDWQLHATAMPDQLRYDPRNRLEIGEFDVRLDRDGAFKFAVMTVFTNGSSEPATVDQLGHDQTMTIVVDTRPPNINLKALPPRAKGDGSTVVGIEWNVEDDNLARNTLRLEGRWWGNVNWTNFFRGTGPEESGRQEWTLRANQRMEVRIVASDRAGNQATKAVVLGNGVANVTGASAAGGNDGGPLLSQPTYRMVSTKTVNLSYRVRERPPSGLEKIELWCTRLGSDWKKYDKAFPAPDENAESADVTFEAQEDGAYGFIMIATSRAGVASQPAPRSHDTPQIWVEVDTRLPEAKLKTVRLSNPGDSRTLVLEWEASDKNIEALPILFEYCEVDSKSGVDLKWQELTTPLPNSGRYVCPTPQLSAGCYLFRVRMHVFDKAGNMATVPWDKPISADVAKPQVEIIDVKQPPRPGQAPQAPPSATPSLPPPK